MGASTKVRAGAPAGSETFVAAVDAARCRDATAEEAADMAAMVGGLPRDGSAAPHLGFDGTGRFSIRVGVPAWVLSGRGLVVAEPHDGHAFVLFADVLALVTPAGRDCVATLSKLRMPGDEALDLDGIAALAGSRWMAADDPRLRPGDRSDDPEVVRAEAFAADVMLAETGAHLTGAMIDFTGKGKGYNARAVGRGRIGEPAGTGTANLVLRAFASTLRPALRWVQGDEGMSGLESSYGPEPIRLKVARPATTGSASLDLAASREARARVHAALAACGAGDEVVAEARRAWPTTGPGR